jgi:type II secretory pathway pseudopilin PulG
MIELLFALVLLAIGVLAAAQMFPAGSRAQNRDRMLSTGNYYSQDKLEELRALGWDDAALSAGRHPEGTGTEALGERGAWQRYYEVTQLTAPMDNLKKISVVVRWRTTRTDSVSATTYVRR